MNKGVIWDLDGVLADTAELHFRCWVTALAEREIPLDRQTFDKVFGMNNRDTLTYLLGRPPEPFELETISGRKEEIFRMEAQWLVRPMPGALTLLEELEEAGWLQAVASSAPKANMDLLLAILGARNRFQAILSGEELETGKPDPTLFLRGAKALQLSPDRCVVVEDAPAGVEAAHRTPTGRSRARCAARRRSPRSRRTTGPIPAGSPRLPSTKRGASTSRGIW